MTVIEKCEQNIVPAITALGYEVVEISYVKKYGKDTLTFYIWKKEGVSLDDCVAVNDALEGPLEANDLTDGREYVLNVSSPGLDRELTTDDDLRRNLDIDLEATLKVFIDKKGKIIGKLTAYDATTITLSNNNQTTAIQRSNIKSLKAHIKF